jgi:hypothetical protein
LKYLNVNSLLKGGLFCKIETGFLGYIKNERRERGRQPRGEKCPPTLRNSKLYILPSF